MFAERCCIVYKKYLKKSIHVLKEASEMASDRLTGDTRKIFVSSLTRRASW